MISLGNIHINPDHFKEVTKDEFLAKFRGKTNICLNKLWALLEDYYQKEYPQHPFCEDIKKKEKKIKVKRNIDSSI